MSEAVSSLFVLTAVPLGLVSERNEPARRIVACAGIAGALAILVDRFISTPTATCLVQPLGSTERATEHLRTNQIAQTLTG